jgi:hypothetical protein
VNPDLAHLLIMTAGIVVGWLYARLTGEDHGVRRRVRADLDQLRGDVVAWRRDHNPACDCDWDKGVMTAVETVEVSLGMSHARETAAQKG